MVMHEWAKRYVEDVVRAAHPYVSLDSEKILEIFERRCPEILAKQITDVDDDTLNVVGHRLHDITTGALHLLHFQQTGQMHPGLAHTRA